MAIQFFCAGCRQPIEVDDEMAGQTVTCPYCRTVVTTPRETDPAVAARVTTTAPAEAASASPAGGAGGPPATRSNALSWASLVCVLASLVCIVGGLLAFEPATRKIPPNSTPQERGRTLQEEMKNHPGPMYVMAAGVCLFPTVGAICGVGALVKRTPSRWPAVLALLLIGVFVLFLLAMAIVNGSRMAAPASG